MEEKIEVKGYIVVSDRYYTSSDEWVKIEHNKARIGVTDYAQKQLKDIVGVELCEVGRKVRQGEVIATLDSIKATAEVYAPLAGTIEEVNERLVDAPELINNDPYGDGWIAVIVPSNLEEEKRKLLTPKDYAELIKKR
uniref:Probable glycine cleavage system H protein n=1 Tax=Fervidicoccus fontis TaxID=683846 RepID=A0A7J3ZLH8_9CREN